MTVGDDGVGIPTEDRDWSSNASPASTPRELVTPAAPGSAWRSFATSSGVTVGPSSWTTTDRPASSSRFRWPLTAGVQPGVSSDFVRSIRPNEQEPSDEAQDKNRRGGQSVGGVGVLGAAGVVASSADDNEAPISGADLQRASDAALAATGEGGVTDTEVGDEESYYEVEVPLDDGSRSTSSSTGTSRWSDPSRRGPTAGLTALDADGPVN